MKKKKQETVPKLHLEQCLVYGKGELLLNKQTVHGVKFYTSHGKVFICFVKTKVMGIMTMAMQKLLWVEACVVPRQWGKFPC